MQAVLPSSLLRAAAIASVGGEGRPAAVAQAARLVPVTGLPHHVDAVAVVQLLRVRLPMAGRLLTYGDLRRDDLARRRHRLHHRFVLRIVIGSTFSLSPDARRVLQQRFGDKIHFAPRIFIAHETCDDVDRVHGSLAKQLVALLTGLSDEQLAQVTVKFRDPVTNRAP